MLILLLALILPVMADNSPDYINVQNAKKEIEKKQEEKKWEINKNHAQSEYITGDVYVPVGGKKYKCDTTSNNQIRCYDLQIRYNPAIPMPQISIDDKQANPAVPNPTHYKGVFKLVATAMYMFALIYFLTQIALEGYRKRYMQALVHLFLFLVGSSMLYYAYRAVFNVG
jgi:hypothetical protein